MKGQDFFCTLQPTVQQLLLHLGREMNEYITAAEKKALGNRVPIKKKIWNIFAFAVEL